MKTKEALKKKGALQKRASLFAALGDATRLTLILELAQGKPQSIAQLDVGSPLTRQAITKHLHVLQERGVVNSTYAGRENLFELNPQPFENVQEYLKDVGEQWENALKRL